MSMPLFKAMFKIHGKNIFSYAFGAVMYQWLIIWIYPSIAKSSGMNDLLKSMPASIQRAFGLQSGFEKIGGFLAGEFYGLLFVLILIIFTVMISIQLISRLIDNTSMAYLLSTPVSRSKIVITQISMLLFGLFVICGFTAVGGLMGIS
ncbi:MAG: ABC transporter permease subunit, partial [Bacillota bacterium]|nr:ABC transporter permease subunit [Bacillota bacterium]